MLREIISGMRKKRQRAEIYACKEVFWDAGRFRPTQMSRFRNDQFLGACYVFRIRSLDVRIKRWCQMKGVEEHSLHQQDRELRRQL